MSSPTRSRPECFTDTYTPPALSLGEMEAVRERRRAGMYINHETRDEALLAVRQLMETPTDKVVTLIHTQCVFSVYNTAEFLAQVKLWKGMKVKILKCNIVPIKCGAFGDAWMMTVTPDDATVAPMSPLAMAFNVLVSGFSYIAKDKGILDVAWSALGRKE